MSSGSYSKLLYQYEVIRARLEIREHYLQGVVKDVYDNIAQVLSVVRVQLSLLQPVFGQVMKKDIDQPGDLVATVIKDLRIMCERFFPETEIATAAGFSKALGQEIVKVNPGAAYVVTGERQHPFKKDVLLLLFRVLLEIMEIIGKEKTWTLHAVTLQFLDDRVAVEISYDGESFKQFQIATECGLPIESRTRLVGGSIKTKRTKDRLRRIKLVIPIKPKYGRS